MEIKIILIIFILFPLTFQESKIYSSINNDKNNTKVILKHLLENYEESEPIKGGLANLVIKMLSYAYNDIIENNYIDLENEDNTKCIYQGLIEQLDDGDLFDTCITGSGKSLNDFGNEFECDTSYQSKAHYFTIHFSLRNSSYLTSDEDTIFMDFLDQHYFYLGLCVPKQCKDAIKSLIKNEAFLEILHKKGSLSNFKVYFKDELNTTNKEKFYWLYKFTIHLYIFIIILKIFIGIVRIIVMNKGYAIFYAKKYKKKEKNLSIAPNLEEENIMKEKQNEVKKDNNSSSLSLNYNESNSATLLAYNEIINRSILSDEVNLYNPFSDKEKNYPLYLKLLKIMDFFDNVNILSLLSNKYYNSIQIKRFYLIRFVLMIMSIVYQLVYSQMDLPYRNFVKYDFYTSVGFIFIKLCINASTFWITLDAVIIGYKIMAFMKKEITLSKNGSLKFFSFFKFLLLVIPKFLVFFFAFVYLHIFSSKLTFHLCEKNKVYSSFLYYNDTIQQRTFSIRQTENNFRNILKNFVPFKLNYIDFFKTVEKQKDIKLTSCRNNSNSDNTNNDDCTNRYTDSFTFDATGYELPSPFLTNTELFVNVYLNEFYLTVLMLFISYFSYLLHNKIFDYIILIINIILYYLPLLDLNKHAEIKKGEILNYTLRYVLGQNYTEKYTHYFINFFYFGFLIGVMKFYYDEHLFYYNQKKRNFQKIKLPFEFCEKIIMGINKIKFIYKRLIMIFIIIILLLFSSSFFLIQAFGNKENNDYVLEKIIDENNNINYKIYYLFLYEKNLCGIFFFIFLMIFIVYPKKTNIIKLAERKGFIIIERISFCFYCSFSYLIYAQFCVFIITLQLSYMNLFLNTLGMFLIIVTFSLFNTAVFELPLRQLIKSFMNKNLEQKFTYYYENYRKRIQSKKEK